ncbi:MAG: hypothetical protein QXF12_05860 [Candidatus Aenigmatarchaeota archaeon]
MFKRIILTVLIMIFALNTANAYICCRDYQTNQQRCFASGECCGGFWYQDCEDFELWSGDHKATIGMERPINIYVRNLGGYTFEYTVTSYQTSSSNVIVSLPSHSTSIGPKLTGYLQPKIVLLSQTTSPIPITFTVTNRHTTKQITVNVSSEEYFSLSEFGILTMIALMASSMIYMFFRKV